MLIQEVGGGMAEKRCRISKAENEVSGIEACSVRHIVGRSVGTSVHRYKTGLILLRFVASQWNSVIVICRHYFGKAASD